MIAKSERVGAAKESLSQIIKVAHACTGATKYSVHGGRAHTRCCTRAHSATHAARSSKNIDALSTTTAKSHAVADSAHAGTRPGPCSSIGTAPALERASGISNSGVAGSSISNIGPTTLPGASSVGGATALNA
jgi:hypothetical protein